MAPVGSDDWVGACDLEGLAAFSVGKAPVKKAAKVVAIPTPLRAPERIAVAV